MKINLDTLFRLDGKTAVITGAGRGIGKATAELFASAGASVVVADIDPASGRAVADELQRDGLRAAAVTVDVAEETSVEQMCAAAVGTFGSLDILVHGAGIFPKIPLLTITVEQWDRIQAVNLRGTMLCLRAAILRMRAGGRGGAVVNISSVSSRRELIYHNAAYGASKAGVSNLTKVAALEFAADKIRVNAVLPGGVATEGAMEATAELTRAGLKVEGPLAGSPGRMLLGRIGTAADIANACLFLASPAADYITGEEIVVDGGFLVS
jgi:NAD(P)-dependent dehydrogenase (short-subunit alcohol dehydrogenase family)